MQNKITTLIIWIFLGLFICWIDYEERKEEGQDFINYHNEGK